MNVVISEIGSVYKYKTERTFFRAAEPKRNVHILSYQEYGWYDHYVNSDVIPVKKDMIFFINREDDYSVKCREYGESICVTFKGETNFPTMTVDCAANPEIKNMFRRLLNTGSLKNASNLLTAMSIIYGIFAFMASKDEKEYVSPGVRGRIEEAHSYLTENYKEYRLNTTELAEKCGITAKYFRTQFKKMYNTTPVQYLLDLRLSEASELLSQGMLNVSEVADAVGFSDIYYFSKMFKKRFSVSPKDYGKAKKQRGLF